MASGRNGAVSNGFIRNQPGAGVEMNYVGPRAPGLGILANLDTVIIKQKVEMLEAIIGYETRNRYSIKSLNNAEIFFAFEKSGALARNLLGNSRQFTMHIVDRTGNIAHLIQTQSCCEVEYLLRVNNGQCYEITGPCEECMCGCEDKEYKIYSNGSHIGSITKTWRGLGTELFTNADNFYVYFPKNVTISEKVAFIGSTFLIDFMQHET